MGLNVFSVSLSGLNATLEAIRTTQHNIANAKTDGYHRQELQYVARTPEFVGGNYYGTGVMTQSVSRVYNQFLDDELRAYQGKLAGGTAYADYAGQIDSFLGNASNNIDSAIQDFFESINEVANEPTSSAAREQMLAEGKSLAAALNSAGSQLEALNGYVNQEVRTITDQVNDYARQIAALNAAIGYGGVSSSAPNDLLDQRDQLISQLNELVNVSQVQQSDGSVAVLLSNGQPLVVGSNAQELAAVQDPADTSQLTVAVRTNSGDLIYMDTTQLKDGRLGGLLDVRAEVIQPSLNDLGRLAIALSDQVNQLHAQGYDLTGATGNDFFGDANALLNQPKANANNSGALPTMALSLADSSALTGDDYELSFDGSGYTLTRLSDGNVVGSLAGTTGSISFDGLTLNISGAAPNSGDRWSLRPTNNAAADMTVALTDADQIAAASGSAGVSNGVGDNGNALLLAALQTTKTMSGGNATYSGAFNQMVTRNAILAASADSNVTTYTNLADIALDNQQSISGVNLDEEAAKLVQYQQAYQASAKAMQIASSLFDELLSIM